MFVPIRNLPIPSPISPLFLAGGEAAAAVPLDSEGGGGGGRVERRKKLKRERVEGSASAASLVLGGRRRRQAAEGEDSEEREDEEPKRTPLRFANPLDGAKKKPRLTGLCPLFILSVCLRSCEFRGKTNEGQHTGQQRTQHIHPLPSSRAGRVSDADVFIFMKCAIFSRAGSFGE